MPWSRLDFAPGVSKDKTRYSSEGQWVDSSLVRFRDGKPERWQGWVQYLSSFVFDGFCRSLHRWADLNGYVYNGVGTNSRYYITSDDLYYDVTPIREVASLTDPFDTVISTPTVTVHDTGHGALPGDAILITSASPVGGLTISGEYIVTGYIDDDTYTITASSNASSTVTGGGGATTIDYLYAAGSASQAYGGGWGADTWGGDSTWGDPTAGADNLGLWSQDNWGEDLVANIYDGPIFYWDATNPSDRMIDIRDLPGADGNAPTIARFIAVSHKDRHLLAFGPGEEFGGTEYAPMTVRWCSQEDIYNWNEADETGTAGSIPLSRGSQFVAVQPTLAEILVWSDTSLYSMQFVGAPDVYIATIIADHADIAGKNAATTFGTNVFWMGRTGFYAYDGRVQPVQSTVWNYVSNNLNWEQSGKVFAAANKNHNEVIWYYPSANSLENDSYVAYDVEEGVWTVGLLARTAWLDMDFQYQPMAASPDHHLYFHDVGLDDGSQNPPIAINSYIESAPVELSSEGAYDKGDRFAFIRRILPDVTFLTPDGVHQPQMNIVIKMMNTPGGGFKTSSSSQVVQTATIPIEEFTGECHVRLRGRSITIRYESDTLGTWWRGGTMRYDLRPDGQR